MSILNQILKEMNNGWSYYLACKKCDVSQRTASNLLIKNPEFRRQVNRIQNVRFKERLIHAKNIR